MKMLIDRSGDKGLFFLSGSQQFHMMKNVSESLAGRVGIITLPGISLKEESGIDFTEPFIPTDEYFERRRESQCDISMKEVWRKIHRGRMPQLVVNEDHDWQMFYGAYVRTYIERDVRDLTQVGDEGKFLRFMISMAARTGSLLNLAELARDVGISQPTAERWLSVLVASNIVYMLQPYSTNVIKRAIKTPKIYFLDTGLAAYLTRWNTAETLQHGAMSGSFFESWVISEIISSYHNFGILESPLYFYRDKDKNEIDLLIERDGTLYPIEIKKHSDPTAKDISVFRVLGKISDVKRGSGGIICTYENLMPIREIDKIIPVTFL